MITPVSESSLIKGFDWDASEKILRVWFQNNQVYDYFFVPTYVMEEFKEVCENPESVGKWFGKNIKKTYEFLKVTGSTG